jgi:hypothetical protein
MDGRVRRAGKQMDEMNRWVDGWIRTNCVLWFRAALCLHIVLCDFPSVLMIAGWNQIPLHLSVCSRVFRDRLVNQQDRTWYDNKMVEVLENEVSIGIWTHFTAQFESCRCVFNVWWGVRKLESFSSTKSWSFLMNLILDVQFCKAWAPESFVDVCWGDFLQSVSTC